MTASPSQTENSGIAARYYAPPTFTSRDPHFERYFWHSPYAYCANNPMKFVDPTGEEIWVNDYRYMYQNGRWGLFDKSGAECGNYIGFLGDVCSDLDNIRIAAQKDDELGKRFDKMMEDGWKVIITDKDDKGNNVKDCHYDAASRKVQYDRLTTDHHIDKDKRYENDEFRSSLVHELLGHAYSHCSSAEEFNRKRSTIFNIGKYRINQEEIGAINIENRFRYVGRLPHPRTEQSNIINKTINNKTIRCEEFFDITKYLDKTILDQWEK